MIQNNLFHFMKGVEAKARSTDPETSFEAAESIMPKLNEVQQKVEEYAISRNRFGFTDYEMNEHFNHTGSTYRSRRAELADRGVIIDTGRRKQRGEGGRNHIVWMHRDYK
jgi:hypothetical protein